MKVANLTSLPDDTHNVSVESYKWTSGKTKLFNFELNRSPETAKIQVKNAPHRDQHLIDIKIKQLCVKPCYKVCYTDTKTAKAYAQQTNER